MTKEELCTYCKGYCCNIYAVFFVGNDDKIIRAHAALFKNKTQFGVDPLERVNDRCEYLGEEGCIIKKENRPSQCLQYECDILKMLNHSIFINN